MRQRCELEVGRPSCMLSQGQLETDSSLIFRQMGDFGFGRMTPSMRHTCRADFEPELGVMPVLRPNSALFWHFMTAGRRSLDRQTTDAGERRTTEGRRTGDRPESIASHPSHIRQHVRRMAVVHPSCICYFGRTQFFFRSQCQIQISC